MDNLDLIKGQDEETYKKYAQNGVDLIYPVTVHGKTHRPDIGVRYHNSIKVFNHEKDNKNKIHEKAKQLNLTPPNARDVLIEPAILTGRGGYKMHVLRLHGSHAQKTQAHNSHFKGMGNAQNYVFHPHITVDKGTWDKIVASKARTAHEAGIQFHPAELRSGSNTLHTYKMPLKRSESMQKSEGPNLIPEAGNSTYKELELHHGTKSKDKFHSFDMKHHYSGFYPGIYTTTDKERAKEHGNPVKVNFKGHLFEIKDHSHEEKLNQHTGSKGSGHPLVQKLKEAGYHGIKRGNEHIIFDPKHAEIEKTEDLEKGLLSNVGTALGVAVASASPMGQKDTVPERKPAAIQQQVPQSYSTKKMLDTIADVESAGGKLQNHKEIKHGISTGEHAFGKYGLTPDIIRETVRLNPDLKHKHKKALALNGKDMAHYMQDNKGLEDIIAQKHVQRLEHHFGQDPAKIGFAWLSGVAGTHKAIKENKDINNHWHVKKIKDAYSRRK